MPKVAIFDYGAGNIFSLKNSLERAGSDVDVINDPSVCSDYSGILLPGVGNFDPAIKSIRNNTQISFKDHIQDTLILGICLGMEMFFEKSQEGTEKGLGMMNGQIVLLPTNMKIPHMGWNNLKITRPSRLLEGVKDDSWVYFVHSYMAQPDNNDIVVANSDYGIKVPAVVESRNFFGTQFHPEKSGQIGQIIIKNFLGECAR